MQFDRNLSSPSIVMFLAARELLLSYEGMIETKKPRITTCSNDKGGICHMRTMPHGIDFGFLKGARMKDEPKRLTGSGKAMRVLSLSALDKDLVDYCLCQAFAMNSRYGLGTDQRRTKAKDPLRTGDRRTRSPRLLRYRYA